MNLEKKCFICKKIYVKKGWTSLKNWKKSKYCSRKCLNNSKLGNTYKKGKTGYKAWNKGLPGLKERANGSWKGNKAGYSAKHKWIQSIKGSPDTCEHCGKTGLKRQQIH